MRDGSEIVAGQAIVAGRDAPPVFELAEQAFDAIAPTVGGPAVLVGHRPGGRGRDGGDPPAALEPIPYAVRIVGFVGDQAFWAARQPAAAAAPW